MKHILFLGYLVPPSIAENFSGLSVAGNKMQWNIIKNLSLHDEITIDCISVLPLAPYPKDKCLYFRTRVFKLQENLKTIVPGFCNFPAIKQLWQAIGVYKTANKLIRRDKNTIVLCYNLFPQIGLPMRWLKRRYHNCKFYTLLADLPIDDALKRSVFSSYLRKMFDNSTKKSISKCDRFIILNSYVAEKYLHNQPYIVVDGGIEIPETIPELKSKSRRNNVLFCGALTVYNGIINLILAMKYIEDLPIELDIYGDGDCMSIVEDAVKNNPKIHYHGRVSNSEVLKKQNEAWLLVNPRKTDDPISKVTFPSKTFEYLLSGTPVLSTRLNGYGKEYESVMFFCEDSPDGIAHSLRDIYSFEDQQLHEIAARAQRFVLNERNWEKQTDKIFSFISEDTNTVG